MSDNNEIEESSAPLIEHLAELRKRIINSLYAIGVGAFADTVVDRNGENIMGLAENMTIDKENYVVTLIYVDSTQGWRIE